VRPDVAAAAARAGVDSVLVADVPALEAEPFVRDARACGIAPVLIAAANTPAPTLSRIARLGAGYTYCVARAGVTGADAEVRFDTALLRRLNDMDAPPPVLGFGISKPEHVRLAREAGAAGVISGSAIVAAAAAHPGGEADAVRRFAAEMKAATAAQ
jgi:tryptophan synthase alpha chain